METALERRLWQFQKRSAIEMLCIMNTGMILVIEITRVLPMVLISVGI